MQYSSQNKHNLTFRAFLLPAQNGNAFADIDKMPARELDVSRTAGELSYGIIAAALYGNAALSVEKSVFSAYVFFKCDVSCV